MRRPIQAIIATSIIATSVAGIVSLAGIPFFAPLFAQTGAGLREGTAAFGDWRDDRPGDAASDQAAKHTGARFGPVGEECRQNSASH